MILYQELTIHLTMVIQETSRKTPELCVLFRSWLFWLLAFCQDLVPFKKNSFTSRNYLTTYRALNFRLHTCSGINPNPTSPWRTLHLHVKKRWFGDPRARWCQRSVFDHDRKKSSFLAYNLTHRISASAGTHPSWPKWLNDWLWKITLHFVTRLIPGCIFCVNNILIRV